MSERPITLFVVSHTHWDREWYRTAEVFRQRLVHLVDELLDAPPADGTSFLLDGQAIVLDDYLDVRPERAAELSALLRDKRIEAGPWYVLADELIPGAEAIVRNLLLGAATVRRLRGHASRVLYCPDSFGHPAALPDIAAGFGCDLIVLWRGLGAAAQGSDLVRWRGSAGAEVLVHHLPPDGYEFGSSLPAHDASAADRWRKIAMVMRPRAATGVSLLLNGADHHARQRALVAALPALRSAAAPDDVRSASLHYAARTIVESASGIELPHLKGELRDSYGYTWTLQGTLGTRAAQKRRNARAERLLVRDVEPWIALASLGGASGETPLLQAAWRTLLSAQPHDTLCGTSIDAVADAFEARLASTEGQGVALREDALHALVAHDAEAARADASRWTPVVLLRNPAARTRSGVAELTLRQTLADVAVGPGSATRQGDARPPQPWGVADIPLQILSHAERIELTESPRAYPDADRIVEAHAVGWVDGMDGYAVETREQGMKCRRDIPHPVRAGATWMENDLLRVDVAEDGSVTLTDTTLGTRIENLLSFENHADVGDLYTPAIRKAIRPLRAKAVRLLHRGPIRAAIAIDCRTWGSSRKNADTCRLVLELDAASSALRIRVRGDNRSADHRLRLRIRTALANSATIADAAFHAVERAAIRTPKEGRDMELVVPTAPLHRWVARASAERAVVVVSDGLAEYEAIRDGSIAITIVRGVGELSRVDLPERPGHAGWPSPTPAAQSLGTYEAVFAVQLLDRSEDIGIACHRIAEDQLLPIAGETLRSNIAGPTSSQGITLVGDGLLFSAAKPAQEGGGTILRCVNARDVECKGEWVLPESVTSARRTRLDESAPSGGELTVAAGRVSFVAAPREIVTIRVH